MTKPIQAWTLLIALAAAGTAAGGVVVTDRLQNEFALNPAGVVVIENRAGSIQVTVSDEARVSITADRVIRATDGTAVAEARQIVQRVVEGNEKTRIIRTVQTAPDNARWSAHVNYAVVIPRTAHLKVVSFDASGIRVVDVRGQVTVKNMNGAVFLENVGGPVAVENINGDVTLVSSRPVVANAHLISINGSIAVRVPGNANFIWDVDTVIGEASTSFPVRGGRFITPTRFRGSVNDPTNITLVTHTFKGNISVLPNGADQAVARPVRTLVRRIELPTGGVGPSLPSSNRTGVQLPLVPGSYKFATTIGNVRIDEIRGTANIATGAGDVQLGTVFGHCDVYSGGGPLILGEITGQLKAKTDGGNVTVQRARGGGTVTTGGGTILIHYAGGPMQLTSGGGDIVVRQARGPIIAETSSGDIAIAIDPQSKNERVTAKTAKGNVVLTVPAGFGADVDAVVVTSDPAANSIRSDIPGLSVQRDQVGGKTRIRATGRINGGGQRVEIQATDGGIQIAVDGPRVSPMVPR